MLLGFSQTVQVLVPILLLFLPPYLIPHTTVAMVLVQYSKRSTERQRRSIISHIICPISPHIIPSHPLPSYPIPVIPVIPVIPCRPIPSHNSHPIACICLASSSIYRVRIALQSSLGLLPGGGGFSTIRVLPTQLHAF